MPTIPRRTLIDSFELPGGADARALAEGLTGEFGVASISGSGGEYEVQLVSPASLVIVLGPRAARFFMQDVEDAAPEAGDVDEEEEEEDPHDAAEAVRHHLELRLGLWTGEDEEGDDEKPPDDDCDRLARDVVARLLERGLLELVTPRSRESAEGRLANSLSRGAPAGVLAEHLSEVRGVAEVFATDEEMEAVVAECRALQRSPRKRAARGSKAVKVAVRAPKQAPEKALDRPAGRRTRGGA